MSYKIEFKKIKNSNIFVEDFESLDKTQNAIIEFKKQSQTQGGIAVVYAPNGAGKSSFAKVVNQQTSSMKITFEANYDGNVLTPVNNAFHVIGDQPSRNIIKGDTSDYLIGANIQREYELKKKIDSFFMNAFSQDIPDYMKKKFNVSKVTDLLLLKVNEKDKEAYEYLRDIISRQSHGKKIEKEKFMQYVSNGNNYKNVKKLDEAKRDFIINDLTGRKLLDSIVSLSSKNIAPNKEVVLIEQNNDAINVLYKYKDLKSCIVCDNMEYDGGALLLKKTANQKRIFESLDPKTKELLVAIVRDSSITNNDPFEIKRIVMNFISSGEVEEIKELIIEYRVYIDNLINEMINNLIDAFKDKSILSEYKEYKELLEKQPEIDSEELLFIKEVVSDNIGAEITIIRDDKNDKNFKLMLAGKSFLNVEMKELHLSTGEQNFISLAFELLLARHADKEFIVLDDPISSFDSIYKNKIAFCIIKFLENKKQIILTHNTDLVRLLECQQSSCFNLYLLNNTQNGVNGFIPVKTEEKKFIINLYELIKLLRNIDDKLSSVILNEKQFLMSMIPFMRGYAHILKDGNYIYESLSKIMHGYENTALDISELYDELFGYKFKSNQISTHDILSLNCAEIDILNSSKYPLLAETLKQTLVYYHLRMKVEKELVDIFEISIDENEHLMLNQLIKKAFKIREEDLEEEIQRKRKYRVFFTSRKTLINEFNHFEGNMNIFQPAIDIKPDALQKEIKAIEQKLIELRNDYSHH